MRMCKGGIPLGQGVGNNGVIPRPPEGNTGLVVSFFRVYESWEETGLACGVHVVRKGRQKNPG